MIKTVFAHSSAEKGQIIDAIAALNRSIRAKTEQDFIVANQAAYALTRQLIRGRLD